VHRWHPSVRAGADRRGAAIQQLGTSKGLGWGFIENEICGVGNYVLWRSLAVGARRGGDGRFASKGGGRGGGSKGLTFTGVR
jgi:hypothetical protein